jgi:hypothetical protein
MLGTARVGSMGTVLMLLLLSTEPSPRFFFEKSETRISVSGTDKRQFLKLKRLVIRVQYLILRQKHQLESILI